MRRWGEAERYFSAIDRLEAAIATAHQRRVSLRRSLLAEVFSGQLLGQDPADEPALVLLERIRAERDARSGGRRMRRGKSEMTPQKETLL